MEGSEFKEQEEWIAKYRAALEAISKKQPHSQGLAAIVHGVRTHFQTVFRSARDRLEKSTKAREPSFELGDDQKDKKEVTTSTPQPPIGEGHTKEGVLVEQLAPSEVESKKAS